ncbi:hypothetical protein [Azospirillum sp. SYSU D00513]|uniref:hypothetical protein n=1 Tax=Azospirillum sp. SYSU D00513 TaxID=2812561 RepID=UPI001A9634EE|nr:hypothetical protein [Azospirillum sp. SYSU D00513]
MNVPMLVMVMMRVTMAMTSGSEDEDARCVHQCDCGDCGDCDDNQGPAFTCGRSILAEDAVVPPTVHGVHAQPFPASVNEPCVRSSSA